MARSSAFILLGIYPGWLLMMAVHEAGHALHAWASGATVAFVSLPLLGFSRTQVLNNEHPAFVAWGGPIWGCLLPLIFLQLLGRIARPIRPALQLFAGFCLIANGAYLGAGWVDGAGDAGDLIRHGTPVWMLMAFGLCAVAGGLYLWHTLQNNVENANESG